jgi:hypothetical protein
VTAAVAPAAAVASAAVSAPAAKVTATPEVAAASLAVVTAVTAAMLAIPEVMRGDAPTRTARLSMRFATRDWAAPFGADMAARLGERRRGGERGDRQASKQRENRLHDSTTSVGI